MDTNDIEKSKNYLKAKKRVDELKGFYMHFAIYLVINTLITILKVIRNTRDGETIIEALFDFGSFVVWIFWGIGIFFHAFGVFGKNAFFSNEWQERKIKEYMEEDTLEYRNKYE